MGRLTVADKQHRLFKDNIPLAEFVLRIITDKPDCPSSFYGC